MGLGNSTTEKTIAAPGVRAPRRGAARARRITLVAPYPGREAVSVPDVPGKWSLGLKVALIVFSSIALWGLLFVALHKAHLI